MIAVLKKEFKSLFTGVTGPVFIACLLFFTGMYVTSINLRAGFASFEYVLQSITIFLLLIPILTMRSFAEEKHMKTDQLLLSLPMSVTEVVLGKYFAMLGVFALPTAVMAAYPVILSAFGYMAYKPIYFALFGFFILGAALIALCMFISSLTESQVLSAVIGIATLFLLYMMDAIVALVPSSPGASLGCFIALAALVGVIFYALTKNASLSAVVFALLATLTAVFYFVTPSAFSGLFASVLSYLAVFSRFIDLTGGIFDITAIVYLISFAAFFIYLTVQSVEKRRWC